jgi:hypothetical protein
MDLFERECRALGEACAAAKMRLDERAPDAFKQAFRCYRGARAPIANYFERKCLSLRLSAVKRGMVVDATVTPEFVARVVPAHCPVTLEPFDVGGKSPRNPSIDRLVNEVTYLAGNVCALSLRANRAKGERSFEEVAHIAQAGSDLHGLEPLEWMRLASLMYGAWARAFKHADPFLLPLAALPSPGLFTSTSQVVQLLLTRHFGRDAERPIEATRRWVSLTRDAGGSPEQFLALRAALGSALDEEEFPGNAWLHPGVFDAFVTWFTGAKSAVIPAVEELLRAHQQKLSDPVAELDWPEESRYQH